LQAEEVAHGSQRVNLAALHDRRGPRPGRVAHAVRAVILVLPEDLSGRFFQAEDSLLARDGALAGFAATPGRDAIGHVDPATGDRGAGIPAAQGGAPAHLRAFFGERLQDAGFPPDAVPLWAQPAGPVVRAEPWHPQGQAHHGEGRLLADRLHGCLTAPTACGPPPPAGSSASWPAAPGSGRAARCSGRARPGGPGGRWATRPAA